MIMFQTNQGEFIGYFLGSHIEVVEEQGLNRSTKELIKRQVAVHMGLFVRDDRMFKARMDGVIPILSDDMIDSLKSVHLQLLEAQEKVNKEKEEEEDGGSGGTETT